MLVCKYFQLLKYGKAFSKEHREVLRDRIVVSESEVTETNSIYKTKGRWYEIDEKATEERNAYLAKKQANHAAAKKLKAEAGARLADAVSGITAQAVAPIAVTKKDEPSDELIDARERAKAAGVKSVHLFKTVEALELKIKDVEPVNNEG